MYKEQPRPGQAHLAYAIMVFGLTISSGLLVSRIGTGTNTWINELVFLLIPPAFLAWRNKWMWARVYRFTPAPRGSRALTMVAGVGLWLANSFLASVIEALLSNTVGVLPGLSGTIAHPSVIQTVLLVLAMVVLAPFCEETFFRGMMLRSYEAYGVPTAWVLTGVLFGIFHALNGLANVIPATIIGLALSWVAMQTGSIWPGMALHFANNLTALFGASLLTSMGVPIGPSLYSLAAALFGLALAALALRRIAVQTRNLPSGHGHQNLADQTAPVSVRPIYKSVAIWLVVILFVAVGAFEVALRVGTRPAAAPGAPLPPLSNITVGTLNGDLDVAQFYSSGTEDSPQTFYFSYEGAGENMNIDMRIRTPEGSDVWTRHWEAGSISFNDPSESLKLTVPGQWRIEISGTAVNLKIKMNGAVR